MAAQGGLVRVEVDERAVERVVKRLEKYEGRPFRQRMEAAFMGGTRLAVTPMKRAAPKGRTGMLARKVSTRKNRPPTGYLIAAGTKSRAPHAGLVSKGHRIVTRGGRPTGGYVRANPFVSSVISSTEGRIIRFIKDQTLREGFGVTRSF